MQNEYLKTLLAFEGFTLEEIHDSRDFGSCSPEPVPARFAPIRIRPIEIRLSEDVLQFDLFDECVLQNYRFIVVEWKKVYKRYDWARGRPQFDWVYTVAVCPLEPA